MVPAVGRYRRASSRATVDFPEPDSPTSAVTVPGYNAIETSSTARNFFDRPIRVPERRTLKCLVSAIASSEGAADRGSATRGIRTSSGIVGSDFQVKRDRRRAARAVEMTSHLMAMAVGRDRAQRQGGHEPPAWLMNPPTARVERATIRHRTKVRW